MSMDITERMNHIIDESTERAVKVVNTYGKPKYIAAMMEIIVSAMAIVGIQIVSMGFNAAKLAEWQFWVKTAALTGCIFLLFRAVVNARFDKTANREEVVKKRNEYAELSNNKDLDLKQFLDEFNLQTKISVYVSKINRRINRLERKKIRTYNANKKIALSAKINVLKEEIKPERINEIIEIVRVKYYMVFYDDFENIERIGGNGKTITRGQQAYTKAFNKASFNKIWAYVLCTAIMTISIWTFGDTSTITIIANVLSSLVMITTRIVTAFIEADRIYDSTITASYVCKTEILQEYYQWHNKKIEAEIKAKLNSKEQAKNEVLVLNPEVA